MSALPSSPSSWWKRGLALISLHFKNDRVLHALNYGNAERAEAWARETLAFADANLPPDHPRAIQCRQNLASVQLKRENYAGAAEQTKLVAEAHERVSGPTGNPALSAWMRYAAMRFQAGDVEGSEEAYRSVIHTLTQAGLRDRAELLTARYSLSVLVLEAKGEIEEARETLRDVYRGFRGKQGSLNPQTLDAGLALAIVEATYAYSGKALEELRDLVPSFLRQYGLDHPRYATVRYQFGQVLVTVGRSIEAEKELRELHGYALAETLLASAIYHEVGSLICQTLLDQGRYEDAEAFARAELHRLGPDSPNRYILFPNLAVALRKLGRTSEAETLLREGLAAVVNTFGASSRATLVWRRFLSDHFKDLKSPEAVELVRTNLAIVVRDFGPESCNALSQRNLLAYCLLETGQPEKAVDEARATGEAYLQHGRARHPMAIGARETLALALTRAGRPVEAEPIFREVLAGFERGSGDEHRWSLETRLHLAEALRDLGRTAEAAEHANRALPILRQLRGELAPDVLWAQTILQSLKPSP